jgi:energy-coupling factor transporter ATP-binding protein EcfA2
MTSKATKTDTKFDELYFGHATAETEVSYDSDRFYKTYYDRWGISASIEKPNFFLVVGPKGSGKSAVGEYIRLALEDKYGDNHVFATSKNLDEITPGISPISSLTSKLVTEQASGLTDSAWRLYISLQMLQLVLRDQSSSLSTDPHIIKLSQDLQRAGLIAGDYPSVLRKVREGNAKVSLAGIVGLGKNSTETDEVLVGSLGSRIIEIICASESSNHYMLVIDGLDRIIGDNDAYWLTLAGLLRVGADLHQRFRRSDVDLRLLVMCRSDVIRRIRFADADHIVGDLSIHVGWAAEQTVATDSPLWDYLALKAGISPEQLLSFFPEYVIVGQRSKTSGPKRLRTAEFLLTSTRSTPREMSLLMSALQHSVPPGGYITSERARTAVDEFASQNLITVMNAESTGLLHKDIYDRLEEIISMLPSARHVTYSHMEEIFVSLSLPTEHLGQLTEFLFLAGLLGNYDPTTEYVQFYHRRDTYKFKRSGPWALHRGLMYAFNVPY